MANPSDRTERHIVMTADEAEQVRGVTTPGHALEPILLHDGRCILPVSVLQDPVHAKHHEFLRSLPQDDIAISDIMAVLDPLEPHPPIPVPQPLRGAASPHGKDDPLLGPKLKLEWAKRHIDNLKGAIREFEESRPYELVCDKDSQTGENVYRLRVHKCVPVEWSAILGDCVHNLRATLDQLVCSLIIANGQKPTTDSAFPIASEKRRLQPRAGEQIAGISAKAKWLIYALKPYKSGNPIVWKLHRLDIIDKHQGILPVGAAHAVTLVRHTMPGMFIGPNGSLRLGGGGRPMKTDWGIPAGAQIVSPLTDNVEIYRSPSGLDEQVQAAVKIAFDQSQIAQGEPVIETLEEFARFIDKLLGLFERKAL
jgi:hypothetical protein